MRIAHIVCTYPPYYGGMGNAVFQIASHLVAQGHEVEVFTPGVYESRADPSIEKTKDYARRLPTPFRYGNAAYIGALIRKLDTFDIVHLHYPFFGTVNMVRRWRMRQRDRRLVVTYHMDTRAPGWKGALFSLYAKYLLPKILDTADCLIVSSFDFLRSSQAAFHYTAHPKQWHEIAFGVDVRQFFPREKPQKLFAEYQMNPNIPTILFVGGMDEAHYFKGIPVLLDALVRLKGSGFYAQTIFVGAGALKDSYETRAKNFGISDRVRFVGAVSNEELPLHYNLADLFILPSTTQGEAFGMVLLEAMASGVPVIASDLPGVRTIADDGGLTFPPGDSAELMKEIIGFFSEETDREEWKKEARRAVEEKYTWEKIVDQIGGVYREMM